MVPSTVRVIYGDTDQMGVVYYANYLRYFEVGRTEFLRSKGMTYRDFEREHRLMLPVVEAGVRYKASARYDDLLTIETSLAEGGRASVRFEYRIVRGEALIATGHTVHACMEMEGGLRRLPRELLERLQAGEAPAGAGHP